MEVLKPAQIDKLFQRIIKEMPKEETEYAITGIFLSCLIQNSYDNGNNDFILNTRDVQMTILGYKLKGKRKNKMKITIQGNAGLCFGEESKYCHFNIHGNAERKCGNGSENSTYSIEGSISKFCGDYSKNCIFTSPNKKTFEKMERDVPNESEGKPTNNKVIYTGK